jgi:hypothetical protein
MTTIDRRSMLMGLGTAAVAAAGLALMPNAAEAIPLSSGMAGGVVRTEDDLIAKAQVVMHSGRRRRRRWVCWWHRGRRVCGWRWR